MLALWCALDLWETLGESARSTWVCGVLRISRTVSLRRPPDSGPYQSDSKDIYGIAASPGVVEGNARVIFSASQLGEVLDGELLVCPITAPSWAPAFGRIKGAVSDISGIVARAAIVSREYGFPAVVGTGFGTKMIKTGQRIRVDGTAGVVTNLDEE